MTRAFLFRATAVLWALWGLLHFAFAFPFVWALHQGVEGLPASVLMDMAGQEAPLHVTQALMEHGFNNAWFGLVVSVGSLFVWRGRQDAVVLCSLVGGLAHLGFTLFVVLPGYADAIGVTMTGVVAAALSLGGIAVQRSPGTSS